MCAMFYVVVYPIITATAVVIVVVVVAIRIALQLFTLSSLFFPRQRNTRVHTFIE